MPASRGRAELGRRVDADHLAARVDQRPARVAAVDRASVSIAWTTDEPARRVDAVLHGADDAAVAVRVELERVADRNDGVADLHPVGVAERQRRERARVRVDLQHRDAGDGSTPTTRAFTSSFPRS